MKTMNKTMRILSIFALVLCLVMTLGLTVFATGEENTNVAKVGNTEYATIDEAIANWTNGTTLTLLSDVTLSDVVTLKSTEHHILNLNTYTMTAASGKNAFVIQACGNGSAERYTLTINADATNPGGINAGTKCVVYYKYADGGIAGEDRPIIKINGGVFTGSTSSWGTAGIYTIGTAARKCATLNISGGTFNCSINGSGKSKLIISGGTFNYSVGSQGDSTANRLISGGKFKTLGFMTADSNNTKFWFGTSMGNSNVGLYVNAEGYLVVGGSVITELSPEYPAVASNATKWNSYLQYSSAATYGLYYEDPDMAIAKHGADNVTVYEKPAVTIPDVVAGDETVIEEIRNNTALKDYEPTIPENVEELVIELVSVENKIVYDVTPKANDEKVEPSAAITFRLPVPASVTKTYAKVYHEDTLMGIYKINGEDKAKYVEISSSDFSEFAIEPTDAVASVNDVTYADLESALSALKANGGTLTLLADLESSITLNYPADGANVNITIDLNGFTVSSGESTLWVSDGYVVTVKDSAENGKIVTTGDDDEAIAIARGGKVILEGGYIGGIGCGIYLYSGNSTGNESFVMNGGTVEVPNGGNAITVGAGNATINKGNVWCNKVVNGAGWSVYAWGTVEINGGDFRGTLGCSTGNIDNSQINVMGGTFTLVEGDVLDPDLLAPYYEVVVNAKNTLTVCKLVDALSGMGTKEEPFLINNINELKWFRDDVNNGNRYNGQYVKLTSDIDLNGEEWTPIGNRNVDQGSFLGHFDGGEHTIYNLRICEWTKTGAGFFSKVGNQTEYVSGSVKNITFSNVTIKSNESYVGVIAQAPLGAYIENVNITGIINISGYGYVGGIVGHGYPTINNCSVVGEGSIVANYWGAGAVLGFSGDYGAKVTNATVEGTGEGLLIHGNYGGAAAVTGSPYGAAVNGAEVSNLDITSNSDYCMGYISAGGTVSNITMENVTATAKGEPITPADAKASINDNVYFNITDAFAAVKDGDVLYVLSDITLTKDTAIVSGSWVDGLVYTGDKSFTIDFGGHTVTDDGCINDYLLYIKNLGEKDNEITLTNGKLVAKNGCWATICVGSNSSRATVLNLNGMTVTNSNDDIYSGNHSVRARNGCTVNVNAGTYLISDGASEAISATTDNAVLNINSGATLIQKNSKTSNGNSVFAAISGKGTINVYDGATIESDMYGVHTLTTGTPDVNIYGGTFTAKVVLKATTNGGVGELATIKVYGGTFYGALEEYTENGQILVSGGKFDAPVSEDYCAEGFIPAANEDGTYGVEEISYAAEVNGTKYETLAEAIAAATAGQTITLLSDVNEDVTINKNLTIDGAGKNYTGNIEVEGSNIEVIIKNVNFVGGTGYAITSNGTKSVIVENCTVDNYAYGFLYAKKATPSIAVKNVEISNCGFGLHYVYGLTATLENVTMTNVDKGIFIQNYADKTVVVKNSTITSIAIWERDAVSGVQTFKFEGDNTVDVLSGSQYAKYVVAIDSTLTAPAGLNIGAEDGCFIKYENGKYFAKKCVAKIGEECYEFLQDAIDAAKDGDVIVINSDFELVYTGAKVDGLPVFVAVDGKKITIDLNGKKITGNSGDSNLTYYAAFAVDNDGSLTLKDSVGEGSVEITGEFTMYSLLMAYEYGANNATKLIVEGGSYYLEKAHDSLIFCGQRAEDLVYIKGGTFKLGNVGVGENGKPWIFNVVGSGDGFANVTGGTFNADVNRQFWSSEVYIAKECYTVNNGDGTWTVEEGAEAYVYTGMVSGPYYAPKNVGYKTLAEAIAAATAANDKKVVLLKDTTITAPISITTEMTIDLSGFTVSYESDVAGEAMITNNGNLTVTDSSDSKSGKIVYTYTGAADTSYGKGNYTVVNNGTLTLESGTIENATAAMSHASYAINTNAGATLTVNGGKVLNLNGHAIRMVSFGTLANNVTINGGYIEGTRALQVQLPSSNASVAPEMNLVINGGELKSNENTYNLAIYVFSNGSSGANVTLKIEGGTFNGNVALNGKVTETMAANAANVTGGTFNGQYGIFSYANDDVAIDKISISGGEFATNYSETYALDDGYIFIKNEDGTYGLKEGSYVAELNGTKYETLAEAIAAAKAGDTVTLIADITVTDQIKITDNSVLADITIDGNGHTITADLDKSNESVFYFGDNSQGAWATGVKIKNVTIEGTARFAIMLVGGTSSELTNVTVKGDYYYGINLYGTHGATMTNCDIVTIFTNGQDDYPLNLVNTTVGHLYANKSEAADSAKVFADDNSVITELTFWGDSTVMISPEAIDNITTINATLVAENNGVRYTTLEAAFAAANAGDTVTIFAGDYTGDINVNKAITVIGETDAEGSNLVNISGKLNITADGATVKNLNVNNGGSTAGYISAKDVLVESCVVVGGNGFRYCYTKGTVTFKDSTITGSTYGIHFDGSAGGTIVIDNCVITGWTSFAGTIEKVTITDTKFEEGIYNYVRFYQDAEISGCTFNEKMGVDLAVDGAELTVTDSTLVNGNIEDLFEERDIVNSNITVDNVQLVRVASVTSGETTKYYETLAEAFAAAQSGDTITLLDDLTIDTETYTVKDGVAVTLDMNGKKITVTDNKAAKVCYELFYIYGELTVIGNGTIELTSTSNDTAWAKSSTIFHNRGGVLTINNGTFKHLGGTCMAFVVDNSGNWYGDATTNIYDGTLTSTYTAIRNRMEQNSHGASGKAILNIFGGSINGTTSAIWAQAASTSTTSPATGEINISGGDIGIVNTARSAGAECMTTISGGTVAVFKGEVGELTVNGGTLESVIIMDANGNEVDFAITGEGIYVLAVAKVGDVKYETLQEAFAAGGEVTLLADIALSESVTVKKGMTVTLDLAGHTITGTDTTEKNFGLIQNNGTLTVKDSVGGGKMTVTATVNSGWNRYSAVISNNPGGTLVVESGHIEHLGGTDMAYGIDSLTNSTIGDVHVTINGGTVKSTYRAIRQFLNSDSKQNILVINGGTVEGVNKAVFFHDPSKKANNGTLTIGDGAKVIGGVYLYVTEGSTEWPVEVSISASAVGENGITTKNVPEKYALSEVNGSYTVEKLAVKIGDKNYATFEDALAAAKDGETITLVDDVHMTAGAIITNSVIVDLNGHTLTANYFIELAEGHIVDYGETKGLLAIPKDSLVLTDASYPMFPIWNEDGTGFVFVAIEDQMIVNKGNSDTSYEIVFRPLFEDNAISEELFADGAKNNSVTIRVVLAVSKNGAYSHDLTYTYSDEIVSQVYDGNDFAFLLTVNGVTADYSVVASYEIIYNNTHGSFTYECVIGPLGAA